GHCVFQGEGRDGDETHLTRRAYVESDQFGRLHHASHHLHDRPVRHRWAFRPENRVRPVRCRTRHLRRAARAGDQGADHRWLDLPRDQDLLAGYGAEATAEVEWQLLLADQAGHCSTTPYFVPLKYPDW